MQEARDDVFCFLIARRSVARAALHLGIRDMSVEALDVLGDVLVSYLERLGTALAWGVEASGRSSTHVHVLDAIRAVELCTSSAVQRVHHHHAAAAAAAGSSVGLLGGIDAAAAADNAAQQPRTDASWRGLAEFCFGPDWYLHPETATESTSLRSSGGGGGVRGKVGPSSSSSSPGTANPPTLGWNAPYPDELPPFPRSSRPLPTIDSLNQAAAAVADGMEQDSSDGIPDAAFVLESWGQPASDEDRTKKRVRLDATASEHTPRTTRTEATTTRVDYIPIFYPAFPKPSDSFGQTMGAEWLDPNVAAKKRKLSHVPTEDAKTPAIPKVRSSLVSLSAADEYWGSGWDTTSSTAVVPVGRTLMESGGGTSSSVQGSQIVPLGRASGSRVSRILEGSMDPATIA